MTLHRVYEVYEVILYCAIRRLHTRFYREGVLHDQKNMFDQSVARAAFKADSVIRDSDPRSSLGHSLPLAMSVAGISRR